MTGERQTGANEDELTSAGKKTWTKYTNKWTKYTINQLTSEIKVARYRYRKYNKG